MKADKRVSRKEFIRIYNEELERFFEEVDTLEDSDDYTAHIYGYPITIQWNGLYCDCDDGASAYNCIIRELAEVDKELVNEVIEEGLEETLRPGARVSRQALIDMYEDAVDKLCYEPNKNIYDSKYHIYGYRFTIHWNGIYCVGCDASYADEFIIPMIKDIIDECGNDDEEV